MKNDDLEKTMPIDVVDEEKLTRSARYKDEEKVTTRSRKYKDVEEVEVLEEMEETEEIEVLGDTKEIKNIEEIEEDEKIEETEDDEENETKNKKTHKKKKDGVFTKLKKKFMALPKKNRIFILVLCGIVVILLIVLLVMLILRGNDKPEENLKPKDDVEIVIVDNYYYKEGKLYFLNEEEKEIGSYECENKDESTCFVAYNSSYGEFDVAKKVNESGESIQERIPIMNEDHVFVYDSEDEENANINLYSILDEEVKDTYSNVISLKDNYTIVYKDQKAGLIKFDNGIAELIKPKYQELIMLPEMDNLIALTDKGYVAVDKNGAEVSKYVDSKLELKYYNDTYFVVKAENGYAIYNYKGEELVNGYEFATVAGDYMLLVKDKKVYIRDSKKTKYNEEGYKLNNDSYVKVYNYDEEGQLLSKEISFELLMDEEKVQLLVYKGEEPKYYTLNIIEALANSKHTYINYFDKKIYFYSDEFKEELIGSFTCTNANEINSSEDHLNTCYIASDTIYEKNDMESISMINRKSLIPVIHNRYVFINDGGKEIKLYDLKDKSLKGTYTSVNTYTANNDNVLSLSNKDTYAVVLNKKGKYGLLKISSSNVERLISFEYTAMETVGGTFVTAQKSSTEWDIYKLGDNTALVSIGGRLMGYSPDKRYYKYLDGSSYKVTDVNGNDVGTEKYDYVELYNGYFVGIKGKKLNIYNYEGKKITEEELTVGNYSYSRTEKPAFKVSKKDNNYLVLIYNGSSYTENLYNVTINSYGTEPKEDNSEKDDTTGEDNTENNTEESGS